MCITINHANLSGTKILSLSLENGNHFIAYSNKVKNLSGKPNAMILPIPGNTNPSMFHYTAKYKDFMNEITKKCGLDKYLGLLSKGTKYRSLSKGEDLNFEQFELGMYTVGLAKGFDGARDFINQLPEEKQPEVSEELKKFFEEKYAGWSFAVCVFDSDKEIDAQPIAFEYKPFNANLLYFPTVDGHDGKAPNLDESVRVDHTFIYEHTGNMDAEKFQYGQKYVELIAEVPEFLNKRKYRSEILRGHHKNGDTFIDISKMKDSNFDLSPELKRITPVPHIAVVNE